VKSTGSQSQRNAVCPTWLVSSAGFSVSLRRSCVEFTRGWVTGQGTSTIPTEDNENGPEDKGSVQRGFRPALLPLRPGVKYQFATTDRCASQREKEYED